MAKYDLRDICVYFNLLVGSAKKIVAAILSFLVTDTSAALMN